MNYYIPGLLIMAFLIWEYFAFVRSSMVKSLRRIHAVRMSSGPSDGLANWLWFTEVNRRSDLGPVYYLNIIATCLTGITAVTQLVLGWIKELGLFLRFMSMLSVLTVSPLILVSCILFNLNRYGRSFILKELPEDGGIDSSVIDILASVVFPIILIVVIWTV